MNTSNIVIPMNQGIKKITLEEAKKLVCPVAALTERFVGVPLLEPSESLKKSRIIIPEDSEMVKNQLIQVYILDVGQRAMANSYTAVTVDDNPLKPGDIVWAYPHFADYTLTIKGVEYHVGMQHILGSKMK